MKLCINYLMSGTDEKVSLNFCAKILENLKVLLSRRKPYTENRKLNSGNCRCACMCVFFFLWDIVIL